VNHVVCGKHYFNNMTVYKLFYTCLMDVIDVSVDAIRARDGQPAFSSIWCSRRETGNAVDATSARWSIPTAPVPTIVVVGIYCDGKDDDGNHVTHTLGNVKFDVSKPVPSKWYTIYDASLQPPVRTGRVKITINASIETATPLHIPKTALRNAGEANLTLIAPYGINGLQACVPQLERIHAPYFRTSSGVMLPSGAFLLPQAVADDDDTVHASMSSRLETVLHRYHMTETEFVEAVKASTNSVDVTLLRIMVEAVSYATLHKVKYTPDTQRGTPGDRWETVRLPGSFAGDCEDCAKDLVLECMEWSRRGSISGSRGIDAVARLLSLYVPVMVQGAVGNYKHVKDVGHVDSYMNHEWAALHPRKWFEHVTGIAVSSCIDTVHADLPTLVLEGTGEVLPCVVDCDTTLQNELESKHVWSGADGEYHFYNIPISCSSPVYADRGIIDFVYTSENTYGVPFDKWMNRDHGIRVATTHSSKLMDAMRLVMSIERPVRAYDDMVTVLHKPLNALKDAIRVGYTCKEHQDEVHLKACQVAEEYRDSGCLVDAQVSLYNQNYVIEWYFKRQDTASTH